MKRDGVLIFHSIHKIMKAEKILKKASLDIKLMPVPRQLSSDCGLAITFHLEECETVKDALDAAGCVFEELHAFKDNRYEQIV